MRYATYKDGVFSAAFPELQFPDDMDIPTFLFDHQPKDRYSVRDHNPIWFIDSKSKQEIRYKEARLLTDRIGTALHHEFGLVKDEVVIIFSPNTVYYPLAMWGAFRNGAIVSCANPTYTANELLYQIQTCAKSYKVNSIIVHPDALQIALDAAAQAGLPKSVVCLIEAPAQGPASVPTIQELVEKYQQSRAKPITPFKLGKGEAKTKVAFLSMSSGTTGLPKAVVICHYSVTTNALQSVASRKGSLEGGKSSTLAVLPFYHIYGLIVVLHATLYAGAKLVVMSKFVFTDFLESIREQKITHLYLVPPMVVLLCKHPAAQNADLSSVKYAMTGAAPLTVETMQAARKRMPHTAFGQGYGLTETCTLMCWYPHDRKDYPGGSCGALLPNIKVRIVSPEGKSLGPGEVGEIWFNSPSNARGYLNNEKATKETFDDEGYVHTGDEGYFDDEGALYVTDRIKELIKTKGMQVAPAELEGLLLDHPDVDDVCVIGIKDEYSGELPKAYVVLTAAAAKKVASGREAAAAEAESIKDFVSSKTVRYKWLDGGVEFIDAIPKNPSGKLLRRVLRDRANRKSKL